MFTEVYDLALIAVMFAFLIRPLYAWAERTAAKLSDRLGWTRQAKVLRVVPKVLDTLWKGPGWGAALLFALGTYLILVLADLPVVLYFEHHERAFNLSTYTNATFVWDWFKSLSFSVVVRASLAFGMYGLARRMKRWWLPLGVTAAALMLVASAADPYRGRLFFDQEPLPNGELRTRLEQVLAQGQVEYADIMVEKTSRASRKLQAYFAGQGPTRMIVLNDVLVEQLTPDEIVAAVAHESGHTRESKTLNRLGAALGLIAFLAYLAWMFRKVAEKGSWGVTTAADIRTLPLAMFSIYLLLSLTAPVTGYLSREREREADRKAIAMTGDPAAFRAMLVKACRVNKIDPAPPAWVVYRAGTHPPIAERVAFAEQLMSKQGTEAEEATLPAP